MPARYWSFLHTSVRNDNPMMHRLTTNEVASKNYRTGVRSYIMKFEDDRSLPAERAPMHCQWIQINFQQLTYIERRRKLERENDSSAAQGRHMNKSTCNYTLMLQLSSLPPVPTNQGTQQSWTRWWGEKPIILLWQLDPGCELPSVAASTLVQSFTWVFSVYSWRLRDRPLIKHTGLRTHVHTIHNQKYDAM